MQKSPIEKITPNVQKKGSSSDQESPESPFEVIGDLRQVNEFEETEEWLKAHLPPVPNLDCVDLIKDTTENVSSKAEKVTNIATPDAIAAFAGVPDAFMDSPIEASKLKDDCNVQKQPSVEEESEFDLSFLPTAYMWDQQEKSCVQAQATPSSALQTSPAPPAGFGSPSPPGSPPDYMDAKHNVSSDKKIHWTGDLEQPEASEAESSGESDDTVIEDGVIVPVSNSSPSSSAAVSNDPTTAFAAPIVHTEITPPPKSERKLMQVPTINVIETDEPNYSDEEMEIELKAEGDEVYEVIKDLSGEAPKTQEPELEDCIVDPPKTRPLETEFMEGYSPPSSPVDSDAEYSPKHKIPKSPSEMVTEEAVSQPESLPNPSVSEDSSSDFSLTKAQKSQTTSSKVDENPSHFIVSNEEVDFPENDDEWSDEGQCIMIKSCKTELANKEPIPFIQSKVEEKSNTVKKEAYVEISSIAKSSFMHDDIYDRQSFDYDFDASSPLENIDKGLNSAKERFLSDAAEIQIEKLSSSTAQNFQDNSENLDDFALLNNDNAFPKPVGETSRGESYQDQSSALQSGPRSSVDELYKDFNKKIPIDDVSENMTNEPSFPVQKIDSLIKQDTKKGPHATTISNPESTDPESSSTEPTDSFVDFMRECLKSRQDEEADNVHQSVPSKAEFHKSCLPPSQPTPSMVMDLEQERLTISALRQLGSSQEDEEEASNQDKVNPNALSNQQSSFISVSNPPCSQCNPAYDSTYSKEVKAIDEWVAEAYHLAEHVLTAILTCLSGNTSSFQAVGL